MLCVSMVSRDGKYSARWQSELPDDYQGGLAAELKSSYAQQLRQYAPDEIAVLAAIGESCPSRKVSYVVSSWGPVEAPPDRVTLLANPGSLRAMVLVRSEDRYEINCTSIKADNTVAYDTRCEIPSSAVLQGAHAQLVRRNFGKRLPSVHLEFH